MEERDERNARPVARPVRRRRLWQNLLAILLLTAVWGVLRYLFPPGWLTVVVNIVFAFLSAYVVMRGSEVLKPRLPGWVVLILLVLVWSLAVLYVRPFVQVFAMRTFGT